MLTGRHITIAAILGIALVFALASWRYFTGGTEQVSVAKPAVAVVAKPLAPTAAAPDPSATLNQVEFTQQTLVDDFQLMQSRLTKQEAEIRRLKTDLDALNQRYDALRSFASTAKETRADPVVQPAKKKKKRFVRRSKKRGSA